MGKQNIYSWTPRSRKLKLLFQNGPGTINAIEFDNYANTLYWINPTNFTITATNLNSSASRNLFRGNSSYLPFELTLAPTKGSENLYRECLTTLKVR